MRFIIIILSMSLIFLGLMWSEEEDPFFKKRNFKYYKNGKLVAWEYKSYAEPLHQLKKFGFGFPKYDECIIE